ncbi:LysR family transcriptional regulator [Chelativorans sp. ZYF759]|uniref:LysR substrate-binding domain-containing protein n=1 Tax=Chelativorans sp. ZYF759 TaxID=2692213 RepID=UPI00145FD08B|nr:LysR substrate-binding domain-containing protein [Chelativorans sp. ZYF759]NMG37867.1 LysR family transcriptional regulator [Chelativorans sp. ZYF759]
MRYVQLRAFHHVAICGGFSRAAERLRVTQPAISDQVRRLEEEYDVLLFDRQRRQIRLTNMGERLLEVTRRLFDTEQQALELLSESLALRSGHLRVVADAAHHLLGVLAAFRERYPGVRVTISAGNTESVVANLRSYDADIGVLGEVPEGRDFEVVELNSTPIIAFAAKKHPAATRSSLSFSELLDFRLVLREKGSKTRNKLEEGAALAGVSLPPSIVAEGREAVREIVASGAGIGFVSRAEFGDDPRLVAIAIEGPVMLMDEAMICLKERAGSKLVRAFLDIALGNQRQRP